MLVYKNQTKSGPRSGSRSALQSDANKGPVVRLDLTTGTRQVNLLVSISRHGKSLCGAEGTQLSHLANCRVPVCANTSPPGSCLGVTNYQHCRCVHNLLLYSQNVLWWPEFLSFIFI